LSIGIARGGKQIRSLLTDWVKSSVESIANLLSQDDSASRSKAILTVSAVIGALELARAVSDQALSDEILEITREILKRLGRRNTEVKNGGRDPGKKT
jgi:TetR/AcrR family transcriptional regulator, transcriptional repressor for nem operon